MSQVVTMICICESLSLYYVCVIVNADLLAVTDEDGGIMILNTSMSGMQSIVQGKVVDYLVLSGASS